MPVARFSRGPWSVVTDHKWGIRILCADQGIVAEHPEMDIDAPDAHLISAAPEMYAALEAVAYFWSKDPLAFGDNATVTSLAGQFAKVADQCREALAKARRETP